MTASVKFFAVCEDCGKRQPRATSDWTVAKWMREHENQHRELAAEARIASARADLPDQFETGDRP